MRLDKFVIRHIAMKLKNPFQTVNGKVETRESIIVEVHDQNGCIGYGECVAFSEPFYTYETVSTSWKVIKKFLLPLLNTKKINHPIEVDTIFDLVQGHPMAKASLETAIWDLYAKQQKKSLATLIGGTREKVASGVVISLTDNLEKQVEHYVEKGYKRYKLKVQKGNERETIVKVREIIGDAPIMFDGNGQYGPEDMHHLVNLDDLNLQMIEQPFRQDDFYYHQQLAKNMNTLICLDETIVSEHDAFQAIEFQACDTINVKLGRVGGYKKAIDIHNYAKVANMPLWCGGMLETGIGRAHNVILASLKQFELPGDLSESSRYWEEDVIEEPFTVHDGFVTVPNGFGIGVNVNEELLNKLTMNQFEFKIN